MEKTDIPKYIIIIIYLFITRRYKNTRQSTIKIKKNKKEKKGTNNTSTDTNEKNTKLTRNKKHFYT
jgi:hypothetical protein